MNMDVMMKLSEAFGVLKCTQIHSHGAHQSDAIIKHTNYLKICYTYFTAEMAPGFKLFITYPCSLNFQENRSLK